MHLFINRAVKQRLFKRLKSESAQPCERLHMVCQTHIISFQIPLRVNSLAYTHFTHGYHNQKYCLCVHANAEAQVRTRSSFQFRAYTCSACSINLTLFWLQAGEATKQSTWQPPSWCSETTHWFCISQRPVLDGSKEPAIYLLGRIKPRNFQLQCLPVKHLLYHDWVTALA